MGSLEIHKQMYIYPNLIDIWDKMGLTVWANTRYMLVSYNLYVQSLWFFPNRNFVYRNGNKVVTATSLDFNIAHYLKKLISLSLRFPHFQGLDSSVPEAWFFFKCRITWSLPSCPQCDLLGVADLVHDNLTSHDIEFFTHLADQPMTLPHTPHLGW